MDGDMFCFIYEGGLVKVDDGTIHSIICFGQLQCYYPNNLINFSTCHTLTDGN